MKHHSTHSRRGNSAIVLLTTAASLSPFFAQAQELDHSETEIEVLDTVVVVGEAADPIGEGAAAKLAGSFDTISREELRYEHPDETLELFSKVPGITLSRYNQGIINTDISIRGFAGDGGTPHAKLLIDGVPSNLHNGYNELDQMFPLAIGGIETFKGTSDPRYGLFNLAGNYNVTSRSDLGGELQLTYGSYDSREVQGYWGLESGKLIHNYFLGYREADGYRDHTSIEKYAFSGRWFYHFDDETSLGFILRKSGYEGNAPGYLDRETARTDPRSSASFANQDGGEKTVDHFSVHFDKTLLEGDLQLSAKAWRQNFERERWVRFNEAGSLQNRYDDQDMIGMSVTADWMLGDNWTLRAGVDYEKQDVLEQRFGTVGQSRQRDIANVTRNFDYDLETLGGFVSLENEPTDWLRWNVGLRLDQLEGDFSQADAAGLRSNRSIYDFGAIAQPKANLFISPTDEVTLFANYGRSFQHPFGSALYTAGDTSARDVSLNDGWEAGLKWNPSEDVTLRASYWQQKAKDEFVDVDGTSLNVGETERYGFDLGFNWQISESTKVWGNYSRTFTEIVDAGSKSPGTAGNRLRSVPDYTYSVGASHQFNDSLSARVHLDGQGSYYTNESNSGGKFGDYSLVNLGVDYQTYAGLLSFQINNLLDQDYEYVFESSGTTFHSPGDGVNASLSYTLEF